jgi:hypothetical protein
MLNEQVESVMAIAFELARIREEHGAQSGMYLSEVRALRAEVERLAAQAAPSEEMSPEFTDTARAALLWVLWHHQGGSSKVGQPIRFALGMEQHQPLSEYQVREAQRWEAMAPTRDTANVPPGEWNSEPEGLTPKQAWWAGYRVGKGLPPDTPRSEAVAAQPPQAPVVQAGNASAPAVRKPKEVHVQADTIEDIQRAFSELNAGKRIPADGEIGGAA